MKFIARFFLNLMRIYNGFRVFKKTGQTPIKSYYAMISLFCQTKGYSSDVLNHMIAQKNPPRNFGEDSGILIRKDLPSIQEIANKIKEDGYFVVPNAIPKKLADYLYKFGNSEEAKIRPLDLASFVKKDWKKAVFNAKKPEAVRYDFEMEKLINDSQIQSLLTDKSLINVAQSYLGCLPRIDVIAMWWHTNFSKESNDIAATAWHYDMDRIKWLKFFFYLTDVGSDNGAHCFVKGTHKTGAIPRNLLRKGDYVRFTDEEVEAVYPKEDIIEYQAPRGTLVIEDTRGLHKGKAVIADPRLIFQIQFSDLLFGANYPKVKFTEYASDSVRGFINQNDDVYNQYL